MIRSNKKFVAASLAVIASWVTSPVHAQAVITLQAAQVPTDQPWTEPAKLSYTINTRGRDSYSVDVAGRGVFDLGAPFFGIAELSWNRNNQTGKQQNNLQAAAGLHLEFDNTPSQGPITSRDGLWSLFVDGRISYNRKAVYADRTTAFCVANPTAIICNTQHVESIRGTIDVSPHLGFFESDQRFVPPAVGDTTPAHYEGPAVAHSFGTTGTFFVDSILDNKINPATGNAITGRVSGFKGVAGLALSPRFSDYRLNFRVSVQAIQTTSRSAGRVDDFNDFSHLFTASVDYDLGQGSLVPGRRFRPSVGITYTDGSDPLAGRPDQSTITVGFRLGFR